MRQTGFRLTQEQADWLDEMVDRDRPSITAVIQWIVQGYRGTQRLGININGWEDAKDGTRTELRGAQLTQPQYDFIVSEAKKQGMSIAAVMRWMIDDLTA